TCSLSSHSHEEGVSRSSGGCLLGLSEELDKSTEAGVLAQTAGVSPLDDTSLDSSDGSEGVAESDNQLPSAHTIRSNLRTGRAYAMSAPCCNANCAPTCVSSRTSSEFKAGNPSAQTPWCRS
ncbi:hypothetical protein PybrP1_005313, partial [[Pythium] brassicae (nom. inval.)]